MAFVEFYKGNEADYNSATHGGGIYACEDTGNAYIFGVLVNSNSSSLSGVEEAPVDGNAYMRKNASWIASQVDEVYVGTTEPGDDSDSDIWVNPEDGTIHIKNEEGEWQEAEVGGSGSGSGSDSSSVETVKVTLTSNQTNPNSDLYGVTVTVASTDSTESQSWYGSELTFTVTKDQSYTVTVTEVTGYAVTTSQSFTAVGGNTRSVTFTYNTTVITINLTSNHGTTDLGSATATINNVAYTNGQQVKVATGSSVSVVFSDVTGYATPSTQTVVATNASQTVTGTYYSEWVTVTVSGISTGFTITISGGISATQTTTSQTHKIPYNTSYTITASSVDYYTAPASQTFTASLDTRSVTMTYTEQVSEGIYIYDNTGGLTAVESWSILNNESAVGVAVVTNNCKFVISKEIATKYAVLFYGASYSSVESGEMYFTSEVMARLDFAGKSHTDAIATVVDLSTLSPTDSALAYAVESTITVNSQERYGYVPAFGEIAAIVDNQDAINYALLLIGVTNGLNDAWNDNDYYRLYLGSSTQYSDGSVWTMYNPYTDDTSAVTWPWWSSSSSNYSYRIFWLPVFELD